VPVEVELVVGGMADPGGVIGTRCAPEPSPPLVLSELSGSPPVPPQPAKAERSTISPTVSRMAFAPGSPQSRLIFAWSLAVAANSVPPLPTRLSERVGRCAKTCRLITRC
jgi:hypothetical protein